MPPEQVRGEKDIDARADIYALGVILYECASGKRPFEADTLPHLALLIHEGKPVPLEQLCPELPPAFVEVVRRAMASDRNQRFSTALELAEILSKFGGPSLDNTMEGPAPVVQYRPPTSSATSSAQPIGTLPGSSVSVADETTRARKSSPLVPMLAGGALLVAGGVLGTRLLRPTPEPPQVPAIVTPVVTATAPAIPATTTPATTPPAAAPATSAAVATVGVSVAPPRAHLPGAPEPTKPAVVNKSTQAPTASPAAPPVAPVEKKATRADQKGLAADNPFSK